MPASQGTYLASQSGSVGTAWEGDTQSLPSLQPPVKERKEQRKKKEETQATHLLISKTPAPKWESEFPPTEELNDPDKWQSES